jgi:hypothetical protein
MQQLSYKPQDPLFEIAGFRIGLQVITFENIYGLDVGSTRVRTTGSRTVVECDALTWAGGQERVAGHARIRCD